MLNRLLMLLVLISAGCREEKEVEHGGDSQLPSGTGIFEMRTEKDGSNPACVQLAEQTVEAAFNHIKKKVDYCSETKETKVKDSFLIVCKHPSDSFRTMFFNLSKSRESCNAFIDFYKSNKVPQGFERK